MLSWISDKTVLDLISIQKILGIALFILYIEYIKKKYVFLRSMTTLKNKIKKLFIK